MSADTVSTLFPGRPIRPLPKRPLRERLSAEVASSIQYPRVPQTVHPLFSYPCPPVDAQASQLSGLTGEPGQQSRAGTGADDASIRRANRVPLDSTSRLSRPVVKTEFSRHGIPYPPNSASSSADGYDTFEHTNNKKKRKIPSAAEMLSNGAHHSSESLPSSGSLAVQPLDAHDEEPPGCTTYYGPGFRGTYGMCNMYNVAGPGRGRYGRPRSGRSPLRPLPDTSNSWVGRVKARPVQWGGKPPTENTGIISSAIANAEKLPPHQGRENISLLNQQLNTKRTPATSQFTFTCGSAVTAWPGRVMPQQSMNIRPPLVNGVRGTQVSQTAYAPSTLPQPAHVLPKDTAAKSAGNTHARPVANPKPARRNAATEYLAAARARRQEKQEENRRHPPKPEDIWICHFCEYEDIFGHPPEALIRQYEIKDRKQRQLEQRRRAQWERMKKGKHKGKKNSKLHNKNNNAVQEPAAVDSQGASDSQGTQSEENYNDDEECEDKECEGEDAGYPDCPAEVPGRRQQFPIRPGGNHDIPGT
ncbi:uncharacterized protein PODANS_1_20150 [Podospora anserina S mat+]|uniref:Podospora anserina S mat+ genomic DNA chromosome 1, supercontig 4 n=2 Tax=Podospora anserina TaxID=2587412 RepID=B2AUS7_PODAN|nr:uncharacterized protein PODANS_1_20150 [Podospora anserina S mat+]CAP68150.1 unnamed protein product [Podospora anserina S mat+]CDN29932.1 Putative protein of unknown function [Podospora anserina]CDP24404.1 Putative protein of unknown function [Podospora anserina S mat+]